MADIPKFKLMKNGYNRYEVDELVEKLLKETEEARQQVENYRRLTEQASTQLAVVKDRYQKLVAEITVREKAADDISRLALKEANGIINTAQLNADSIVKEALFTARSMLSEIARIANDASEVKSDMQEQLNALQKSLDDFVIPIAMDEKWLNK